MSAWPSSMTPFADTVNEPFGLSTPTVIATFAPPAFSDFVAADATGSTPCWSPRHDERRRDPEDDERDCDPPSAHDYRQLYRRSSASRTPNPISTTPVNRSSALRTDGRRR